MEAGTQPVRAGHRHRSSAPPAVHAQTMPPALHISPHGTASAGPPRASSAPNHPRASSAPLTRRPPPSQWSLSPPPSRCPPAVLPALPTPPHEDKVETAPGASIAGSPHFAGQQSPRALPDPFARQQQRVPQSPPCVRALRLGVALFPGESRLLSHKIFNGYFVKLFYLGVCPEETNSCSGRAILCT
ncbi:proline-rich receptor-like protein kinase PERK9 [Triticum aestivum]|uniref:proline-rich receptor-like protein kinase PERK9 n=1 Tax=Triticum aestivum TaxID=4565 RepID=UPI001D007E9F|nr:proline-rich receptor-like protein kinase PERK9 [Triticum aestivum]